MPGRVFDYAGGDYGRLRRELYETGCVPSVVLDQCVSAMGIARMVASRNISVIRAYNSGSIDDDEIIRVADGVGALILTKDKKKPFRSHPRTLILRSGEILDDTRIETLANDVWYVLGLADNPGTHPNGNGSGVYLWKLEMLKRCFNSSGCCDGAAVLISPKPRNGYTHNDPSYAASLVRKRARLQTDIDLLLTQSGAAENGAIARMQERMDELQKQITELKKFSLPA